MAYKKLFNVEGTERALQDFIKRHKAPVQRLVDRRDGFVYTYHNDDIELRINVALATGRPLLLRGASGSGKSSLARNVAIRLGRRYYEHVIASNTQHSDLLWTFDTLRRFHDAQTRNPADVRVMKMDEDYLEPKALWWAFSPESARRRGTPPGQDPSTFAIDPSPSHGKNAVVLIDEIDKADPDIPNNLLVALGSLQFTVPYIRTNPIEVQTEKPPLVMITSNEERELPAAFLRRCVTLNLPAPSRDKLLEIAALHYGKSAARRKVYKAVAGLIFDNPGQSETRPASIAEFLDAVAACVRLEITPSPHNKTWIGIQRATVAKAAPENPMDSQQT